MEVLLSNEFEQITDESKFFIVPKKYDTLNTNFNLRKDLDKSILNMMQNM